MDNFLYWFLVFIFYSICGWIIETVVTLVNTHKFVNRGFLIGPYCPIYGTAAILMIFILGSYADNLFVLFVMSIFISSILEYITSYSMEKTFHARWWDYSTRSFNVNGRICLKNSFAFGILGSVLISFVHPCVRTVIQRIHGPFFYILSTFLFTVFVIDFITSFKITFKLKNSFKTLKKDSTEEISKKIKESIESSSELFYRLMNAFPNFRPLILKKKKKRFHLFK
jgi:uncharacterized membrane protein